jgi:hypothetical protein
VGEGAARDRGGQAQTRFLPPGAWLPVVYGGEARAFLERKGVNLGGKKFESFLDGFLTAKREAAEELVRNAKKD